jgi:hypothetical protein
MDHLDVGTLRRLRREVTVVTAAATADLLTPMRFRDVVETGWGESRQFDTPHGGLSIEAFRVQHWGARMRNDVHRGFNGYVLGRCRPGPASSAADGGGLLKPPRHPEGRGDEDVAGAERGGQPHVNNLSLANYAHASDRHATSAGHIGFGDQLDLVRHAPLAAHREDRHAAVETPTKRVREPSPTVTAASGVPRVTTPYAMPPPRYPGVLPLAGRRQQVPEDGPAFAERRVERAAPPGGRDGPREQFVVGDALSASRFELQQPCGYRRSRASACSRRHGPRARTDRAARPW